MKVLVLVDSLALGGAETLLATLARAATQAGIMVQVAALAGRSDGRDVLQSALVSAGAAPVFLDVPRLAAPRAVPVVVDAIRSTGCDVVHSHLEYSAILGSVAARLTGRPAVSTFHHVPAPLSRREAAKERLAVELASRGSRVIFVSDASRAAFAARYGERPGWVTVPNGVDLARFDPAPAPLPADLGGPWSGGPVVAVVAALRPGKGHEQALRVWPQVRAAVPDARLLLVGAGPLELRLRAVAAELGLCETAVVFAGLRTDVPDLLRGVDVVLLPSESEALPTTLVEAAAAGRPAVATRVGGVSEVVVDDVTGVLVPPSDLAALREAVIGLLIDPARRERMGAAARDRAETTFDAAVWVQRLAHIYRDAQSHREARAGRGRQAPTTAPRRTR